MSVDSDRIAELTLRVGTLEAEVQQLTERCRRQGEQIDALARQLADVRARARMTY